MRAALQTQSTARPAGRAGRDVRNLANLGDTASTSRVLNLAQIALAASREPEYVSRPFFRDPRLNKCIIIKHTLRANELDSFSTFRRTATKIMMPFDPADLKLGASSVFVNQTGFDNFCRSYFGSSDLSQSGDVQILKLLDTIPSLDPFLVRELLGRHGFKPANCYLKISSHDVQKMIGFANLEIERLVKIAFGTTMNGAAIKLASKILSNELDKELLPLKMTLRLSDDEFSDGIFSWRGFLYFKWRHIDLQQELGHVIQGLAKYQPRGKPDPGIPEYLAEVRPRLVKRIVGAMSGIGRTLAIYDVAYASLVERGDPAPFRKFLLDGPSLFYELGESIAILGHIASFWAYRMSQTDIRTVLDPNDYADILMDFEDSLSCLPSGEE